jgi:hypothetical protein
MLSPMASGLAGSGMQGAAMKFASDSEINE